MDKSNGINPTDLNDLQEMEKEVAEITLEQTV
jgi:hypothetical protein